MNVNLRDQMTREGWIALLTQVLAALALVAGMFVPPEYDEVVKWVLAGIEAVGMILILIFANETAARLRALGAKVHGRFKR